MSDTVTRSHPTYASREERAERNAIIRERRENPPTGGHPKPAKPAPAPPRNVDAVDMERRIEDLERRTSGEEG